MAKSLRSKWKRKMRSIKRERYGVKELTRLKTMLAKKADVGNLVKMVDPITKMKKKKQQHGGAELRAAEPKKDAVESMEVAPKKYNSKLKDEHGNYPIWLNPRKIKKMNRKKANKYTW